MNTWTSRAAAPFEPEKRSATASRGMVVTNHPLASAAGAEMLAAGGNAIDAAISALFTLTVVEPMMVGILGGGFAHLRLPNGHQTVLEGQGRCPQAVDDRTYQADPTAAPGSLDAIGRRNSVGRSSVAVPGNLMAWCELLARHGTMSLSDVVEPAIRHASRGFIATPFLADCIRDCASDLAADKEISKVFMPFGRGLEAGERVYNGAYADTLRRIVLDGPSALYQGALGETFTLDMARRGGYITRDDLLNYSTNELSVIRSMYRGFEITGPPPPCSGPLHISQMLNLLEHLDVASLGFGTTEGIHLIAEALKMAFADRAAATADPDFVAVPVQRLLSADYARERLAQLDLHHAQHWQAGVAPDDGAHTTHLTVADRDGHVVCATQTINSLFGARYMVPGTGMIPNNYMYVFNPRPGLANSPAPGKRVTSSMAPLIILRDGKPRWALGLPGGLRIFPSAFQAVLNLIDHGMSLQESVEAPRVWTQGFGLELEPRITPAVEQALKARGHDPLRVSNVAGGMCAIAFREDGDLEGAACWRADGTPIGVSGGLARAGVRFMPEASRPLS